MNKYESSGLESKHQQKYAENVQRNQRANREKKIYNPLYPEKNSVEGTTKDEECNVHHESSELNQEENNDQVQQPYEQDNKNK
jgi:hypothetical protein